MQWSTPSSAHFVSIVEALQQPAGSNVCILARIHAVDAAAQTVVIHSGLHSLTMHTHRLAPNDPLLTPGRLLHVTANVTAEVRAYPYITRPSALPNATVEFHARFCRDATFVDVNSFERSLRLRNSLFEAIF